VFDETVETPADGVKRAAESAVSAALHAVKACSFELTNVPGSARPAAGPTAGCLRLRLAARRLSLRLTRTLPRTRDADR